MRKKITQQIPNLFTLTSLFLGFSSILACLQALQEVILHSRQEGIEPNPEKYLMFAGVFIILGCLFDIMDGFMARILKVMSGIGQQLDSLSDLVTFGIAPGVLFYTVTLFAGQTIPNSGIAYDISLLIPNFFLTNLFLIKVFAFLFPITATIRLAKFNIKEPKNYFEGIPSTFAGGVMALIFIFNFYLTPAAAILEYFNLEPPNVFHAIIASSNNFFRDFLFLLFSYLLLSLLMVSKIRFYKIKYYLLKLPKRHRIKTVIFITILVILYFKYSLLIMALAYIFHCFYRHFFPNPNEDNLNEDSYGIRSQKPL